MYKWHGQSALRRGKLSAHDFVRVTEGIAASLRQFSISAARAAEDAPSSYRAKQAAKAVDELSSLQSDTTKRRPFTITRELSGNSRDSSHEGEGRFKLGQDRGIVPRAREARESITRGERGGRRGRGDRGRGRGGRGGKREKQEEVEDLVHPRDAPYTDVEKQWRRHMDGNFADGPYEPGTNLESLLKQGTPTFSSRQGMLQTIDFKMRTGTESWARDYEPPNMHRYKIVYGGGVAVFEGEQEAKWGKEWLRKETSSTKEPRVPTGLKEFTEEDLNVLSKTWAAGHHELPVEAPLNDPYGQLGAYARRNPTYLGSDAKRLQAKLRELLPESPAKAPKPAPKSQARPI